MQHSRLRAIALAAALAFVSAPAVAADTLDPSNWPGVVAVARGETVYFDAWGGEPRINAYIAWAGEQLKARYGITLVDVKVADTADVVTRVLAEKAAGLTRGGAVDLVWINGANFAAMKKDGLLRAEPWATALPNWTYVALGDSARSVLDDFGVPTDGLEAPWGKAQLVFLYDSETLPAPPRTFAALADWAAKNPGRFTYPQPPDFVGTTFLKQLVRDEIADPALLEKPAGPDAAKRVDAIFAKYLDPLQTHLWRGGRAFPANVAALRRLLADGEIDIAMTFDPADAAAGIASGELTATTRPYVLDGGTIGNTHYVAIPYDANAPAAAMVTANFLMSPQAQLRKANPAVWGDPTVLDVSKLSPEVRKAFAALADSPARLSAQQLAPTLPEPHFTWTRVIEDVWKRRYLGGG